MAKKFYNGMTRWLEQYYPTFEKVAKSVAKWKYSKISTSKLNLKVQNIYIKPLSKLKNTTSKTSFETAYLGEDVKKLLW
jgi:hypothetical protein